MAHGPGIRQNSSDESMLCQESPTRGTPCRNLSANHRSIRRDSTEAIVAGENEVARGGWLRSASSGRNRLPESHTSRRAPFRPARNTPSKNCSHREMRRLRFHPGRSFLEDCLEASCRQIPAYAGIDRAGWKSEPSCPRLFCKRGCWRFLPRQPHNNVSAIRTRTSLDRSRRNSTIHLRGTVRSP